MIKPILLLLLTSISTQWLDAQIVINEISAAQNTGIADEDGDYPDWIELYNAGSSTIDLNGYRLSLLDNNEADWIFPSINIEANDHLIVFASEKDRTDVFDHWELPVVPIMPWRYFPGTSLPSTNWNTPIFDTSSWALGLAGIGYGDGDDSTIISPVPSLYMRTEFNLADTSVISIGIVALDYDDSFVAYLNGVEIARNNIGVPNITPLFNELAYEEREAVLYAGGDLEIYFINLEAMNSAKRLGTNVFSVEIHDVDALSDDMSSIPYFAIGVRNSTITYPAFGAATNLHTNFNISSFPSRLKLYDTGGTKIDEIVINGTHLNNSYGRSTDAGSNWCIFDTPTPDTSNALVSCFAGYALPPNISLRAGFYTTGQTVMLSSTLPGDIYYTLDGSIPGATSPIYTSPISVNANLTLKARLLAQDPNLLPSKSSVASYLINETVTLPVISISTDPDNLWDYTTGLYVFGPNADSINYPFQGSNFWAGWEKECHVEYFDRNKNLGFSQAAGLKIHGNFSKAWPQKSFRILAKDDYNEKWIQYQLFPEKPYRKRYKNFNIRNAGIDYNTTHFRDAFMHRATEGMDIEHMAYEPCVLFLNGEYWGVYGLRERQDDSYIEENYSNTNKNNIDLLRFEGDVLAGDNLDFLAMVNFLQTNDLSDDSTFKYVSDNLIDVENVADYFIAETFYCNVDWVSEISSNNVKYWKSKDEEGKWRYILWDTDLGTGLLFFDALLDYNYLGDILGPTYTSVHPTIIKNLLTNQAYLDYFNTRYADLLNTNFHPTVTEKLVRKMEADLDPEMARHFGKWNEGSINIFGFTEDIARSTDLASWRLNVDTLISFTDQRPQKVRDHLQSMFGYVSQVNVTLKVDPPGAGYIKINTIVPDSLPWTGRYFNGLPVTVTAIANPGYTFKNWEPSSISLADSSLNTIKENIVSDETLKANFFTLDFQAEVYPNPFIDEFIVNYELANPTQLSLKLYSVDGKLVKEIISHETIHPEGKFSITISKADLKLAVGMHLLRFESNEFTKTIKLLAN